MLRCIRYVLNSRFIQKKIFDSINILESHRRNLIYQVMGIEGDSYDWVCDFKKLVLQVMWIYLSYERN